MKPATLIHAVTDLSLGVLVGASVGASVAAGTIFGVSREQGFDKHIANTLAGTMFDRLGWPMLVLALVACVGCLYAAKKPAVTGILTARTRLAWKLMGAAAVLVLLCASLTQLYFAPRMADLRENSTWVNGELANPDEKAAFRRGHGFSMAVSGLATLIAAGLILGRRVANGEPGDERKMKSGLK